MLGKLIVCDLTRKKMINLSLFFFILLPALLMSNALSMIFSLSSSLDLLFEKAKVPHFVQMHAGEPDLERVESWNSSREEIEAFQAVLMITPDGSDVYASELGESEALSVMDLGFVRQNHSFDFILNLNNEAVTLDDGEIAVPLYHRDKNHLEIGERVILNHGTDRMEFKITAFTRDAQMNPALIHSKRFVVSDGDFEALKESFGDFEYLLEYRLSDPDQASSFGDAYRDAGLPASGPGVSISLFRIINAVSDGLSISILILLSLLFCITAVFCLRFTLLASLEEDYREIGVMKGIGFPHSFIRNIYLGKYLLMGGIASLFGYALSFLLYGSMTSHIRLYMGTVPRGIAGFLLPFLGTVVVFLVVYLSCLIGLRRFKTISAVQALRAGRAGAGSRGVKFLSLKRFSMPGLNLTLALRDVLLRGRLFLILGLVFFLCSFLILVPVNFLNTIDSPEFISYLGIGRSDIRIDLRPEEEGLLRFEKMIGFLETDPDLRVMIPVSTYRCRVRTDEGEKYNLNVDMGDFTVFPLEYIEGQSPVREGEIALSHLNAKELGVLLGDSLFISGEEGSFQMEICGIYQDVTNGGYTSKAFTLPSMGEAIRHTLSLDLRDGVPMDQKMKEYSRAFAPARVTDIESYLEQTLGETKKLLRKITALSIAVALAGSLLITSLFLRMILARDDSQISIMRGIGFSREDISRQYLYRVLLVLGLGTIAGTLAANSAGQGLVSALWSRMGASNIHFIINPFAAYFLIPAVQILLVSLTALRISASVKYCRIADLNAE